MAYARPMPKEVVSAKPLSRRVTVFRNGRNQAIRIPRDFEFQANEVILEKEGDRLIVQPVNREPSLFEALAALEPLTEEFPDIDEGLRKLDEVNL